MSYPSPRPTDVVLAELRNAVIIRDRHRRTAEAYDARIDRLLDDLCEARRPTR